MSLQDAQVSHALDEDGAVTHGVGLITTDAAGSITHVSGAWLGEPVHRAESVTDLVHERNHDLLDRIMASVGAGIALERAVGVQVRSETGWDEAVVTAVPVTDGTAAMQWCFMPVLPDPLRATVAAVAAGRDVSAVLDAALAAFADAGPDVWATVHFARGKGDQYRSVVSTTGRDTFRRAVEAAVAGDRTCPWDGELGEEPEPLQLDGFGDGIKLAAPHAGIGSCQLVPIPSAGVSDAACLGLWSETAAQLDSPERSLLIRRVTSAVTLAFQIEENRESQRKLATRDGLTGLWNRPAFFAQIKAEQTATDCAVLCIDIDDFRGINDWYGSAVGDEILVEMAHRLGEIMRPGDLVSRVSGDEFAVFCHEVPGPDAATAIADRVLAACESLFAAGGEETDVHVSVGIAQAAPERSGAALFDAAERAMLEAKDQARGNYLLA